MRWDLHIHSQYSPDSSSSLKSIIKIAKKRRLGGIAITDHNSLQGYRHAKRIIRKNELGLIPGYELVTKQGELLIFGVDELIQPNLNPKEAIKLAGELGAVVVASHPFDPSRLGIGRILNQLNVDGIEVINGHSLYNNRAKTYAVKKGLAQTGGSDAHHYLEVGDAWTECSEDPITAIKKRTCRAGGEGFKFKNIPLFIANKASLLFGRSVLR